LESSCLWKTAADVVTRACQGGMAPKGRFALKKDRQKLEDVQPKERVLPRREQTLDLPDALCTLVENYFTIAECERFTEVLQTKIDWRRQQVAVGRRDRDPEAIVAEPRLTLFMSDPGICYEYSGRENIGEGWNPEVLEIKEKAERGLLECGQPPATFNSVQLNRYNGPRHTLGMHADDEPDLLKGAPIVSVSFGCTREFRIQRKDGKGEPMTLELADGSFLLMGGAMQTHYLHGVPPGGQTGLRFNLTFRICVPRAARCPAGSVHLLPGLEGKNSYMPMAANRVEVDRYILENELDKRAADALLSCPINLQNLVISKGNLQDARNPSAALLSRIRESRASLRPDGSLVGDGFSWSAEASQHCDHSDSTK